MAWAAVHPLECPTRGLPRQGLPAEEVAQRGIEAIHSLMKDVDIPATLREYGIDPAAADIPRLVEDAMKSRTIVTNPREVTPADIAELSVSVRG